MNDSSLMHVFFYLAGAAVIFVALLSIIVIGFFIKILRDVRYLTNKARSEADLLAEDLSELRSKVRAGGMKFKYLGTFLANLYKRNKK